MGVKEATKDGAVDDPGVDSSKEYSEPFVIGSGARRREAEEDVDDVREVLHGPGPLGFEEVVSTDNCGYSSDGNLKGSLD